MVRMLRHSEAMVLARFGRNLRSGRTPPTIGGGRSGRRDAHHVSRTNCMRHGYGSVHAYTRRLRKEDPDMRELGGRRHQ